MKAKQTAVTPREETIGVVLYAVGILVSTIIISLVITFSIKSGPSKEQLLSAAMFSLAAASSLLVISIAYMRRLLVAIVLPCALILLWYGIWLLTDIRSADLGIYEKNDWLPILLVASALFAPAQMFAISRLRLRGHNGQFVAAAALATATPFVLVAVALPFSTDITKKKNDLKAAASARQADSVVSRSTPVIKEETLDEQRIKMRKTYQAAQEVINDIALKREKTGQVPKKAQVPEGYELVMNYSSATRFVFCIQPVGARQYRTMAGYAYDTAKGKDLYWITEQDTQGSCDEQVNTLRELIR